MDQCPHVQNINVNFWFGTYSRPMQGVWECIVTCNIFEVTLSSTTKYVQQYFHQVQSSSAVKSALQASNRCSRCTGQRVRLPDAVRRVTDRTRPFLEGCQRLQILSLPTPPKSVYKSPMILKMFGDGCRCVF